MPARTKMYRQIPTRNILSGQHSSAFAVKQVEPFVSKPQVIFSRLVVLISFYLKNVSETVLLFFSKLYFQEIRRTFSVRAGNFERLKLRENVKDLNGVFGFSRSC